MATNIRDGYMSPQVWVAKREQKVIEVLDRLVPARVEYAENIFAGEKYLENGMVKREYALLTMVICEGKGAERKQVRFNFSPDNFFALRRECEPSIYAGRSYRKAFIKRNCNNGELKIRAVTITFEQYQKDREGNIKTSKDGKPIVAEYPWFIGISEETGIADETGEKFAGKKTKVQSFIKMSSDEYQSMIDSTCRYIDVFAMAFGVPLLREKAKIAQRKREEYERKNH
jgi:hypothetical protein